MLAAGKKPHRNSKLMQIAHAIKTHSYLERREETMQAAIDKQQRHLENLDGSIAEIKKDQKELLSMMRAFMPQTGLSSPDSQDSDRP